MKKIYIEGEGGFEVYEKTAKYLSDVKGKDFLFIAKSFKLSKENRAKLYIKTESGEPVYIHILSNPSIVGTELVEPTAITALRGSLVHIKKNSNLLHIYEGKKDNEDVHYLFLTQGAKLINFYPVLEGRLGDAIREIVKRENANLEGIVFLNNFRGSKFDLEALGQSLGISIHEPTLSDYDEKQLIYAGANEGYILPVFGITEKGKTKRDISEDQAIMSNVFKGLGVAALATVIGTVFLALSMPYLKALPHMKVEEKKGNYLEIVSDYGKLFEKVRPLDISKQLFSISTQLEKYELEPISYNIAETSITVHIRTRDMNKALAFRKDFKGNSSEIIKEGPYFNFSITLEVKNGNISDRN